MTKLRKFDLESSIFIALCAALTISGAAQHWQMWEVGLAMTYGSIGLLVIRYGTGQTMSANGLYLLIFLGLFLYTIYTSLVVARSAFVAANYLSAYLLASVLIDIQNNNGLRKISYQRASFLLKCCLAVFSIAHSINMCFQYIETPVRVTGYFNDYSQASMGILIIFGLIYPHLKRHLLGYALTAILFLGFFTSFSRSANFLLILFMGFLLWHELKNGGFKHWAVNATIILFCYLSVLGYPLLINQEVIDRGGIQHFSTLNSRLFYWDVAWQAIKENPWFGYGLQNFEWSGIKERIPFQYIPNVHNDYLQLWLDLGVFWCLGLVLMQVKFLLTTIPWGFILPNANSSDRANPGVNQGSQSYSTQGTIAWVLLILISAYMTINFLINFMFFQMLIAFLVCEVLYARKN